MAVSNHSEIIVPCHLKTRASLDSIKAVLKAFRKTQKLWKSYLTGNSQSNMAGNASSLREVKWLNLALVQLMELSTAQGPSKIDVPLLSSA